jgi:spermidine synthase
MTENGSHRGTALLWIFAASGFAGLVYESIWTQYLGLLLGHSAYAQVLVLALFMGGMALGAWLISRRSELLKRPLALYAGVEALLGVMGVIFHSYYSLASGWAYSTLFPAVSPGLTLEIARWSVAGLLILPQCVLLGMTFPLMSAGFLRLQPQAGGRVLAGLYFSNSLGAALGALVSTFVLLPGVGLPGTVLTAGLIGILVAISVWPLAKQELPSSVERREHKASGKELSAPAFILAVAAVTGASSFVYEISWIRMLAMVLGSTIHAFEIMLAAFILGIACGGFWLRKRADSFASPRRAAGWAQVAMGCMALSTLFLYNQSFSWLAWVMQTLNRSADSAYTVYNIASAGIAMVIMLPTAFFAGMTLPLLTLTLLKDGAGESAIGKTYAANTLGAIVGVVLAVFVGLPMLGLRLSLWLAAAADIVLGILLLVSLGHAARANLAAVRWPTRVGIGASIIFLGGALLLSNFDPVLMSSGVFRMGKVQQDQRKVLYFQDGRTASVALVEIGANMRAIITNGKPDAALSIKPELHTGDEMTMTLAAMLPMVYHPTAASVAIIGFGSGMTTHTVLGNPRIASVDTVEIEPAMVEGARHFRPIVERAYADPRSHIVIDDAKSYFATTRKRYDIIISEPSNPWVNGVASLFTEEFYRFIPGHLNEGGLFVQWVHVYEMTPALIDSISRAMLPYFADTRLYLAANGTDWIIVASPTRMLPDARQLRLPQFWDPALYQELGGLSITSEADLDQIYLGDKRLLQAYTDLRPDVPANSDFFPYLQLNAPQARFAGASAAELVKLKLADWPIADVLGVETSAALDYRPGRYLKINIVQGNVLDVAQTLHAILTGRAEPARSQAPIAMRLAAERVYRANTACQIDVLGDSGLVMLTDLATSTIPQLSREDGLSIWRQPAWAKCSGSSLSRDYLAFIGAVAARDHQETLRLGQNLLDRHAKGLLERSVQPPIHYIVGAMQIAAYARGDFQRVISLENAYDKKLASGLPRTLLVKLARDRLR